MKLWTNALLQIVFPELCICCKTAIQPKDRGICVRCAFDLPLYEDEAVPDNSVNKTFWGRVPMQRVYSLLLMKEKNDAHVLIHALKYRAKKKIADKLGGMLARTIANSSLFSKPDILIPIPLHPKKQKLRGYNQAELIANAVGKELEVPVRTDIINRIHYQSTQTKKDRQERWNNVEDIFGLCTENSHLENQHLMIIDDVLTTGATIDACAQELMKIKGVELSAATLAFAP